MGHHHYFLCSSCTINHITFPLVCIVPPFVEIVSPLNDVEPILLQVFVVISTNDVDNHKQGQMIYLLQNFVDTSKVESNK